MIQAPRESDIAAKYLLHFKNLILDTCSIYFCLVVMQ